MTVGSSPRVWGQEYSDRNGNLDNRIIPTRMGTSFQVTTGGHHRAGSSPRVWGQGCLPSHFKPSVGIIPTRMGTRSEELLNACRKQDHPHAYGDKQFLSSRISPTPGSSPRVWGQVCSCVTDCACVRIIPTRMGTSFCKCSKRQVSRDHPHAYGDKTV